jgi:hypothetical protein
MPNATAKLVKAELRSLFDAETIEAHGEFIRQVMAEEAAKLAARAGDAVDSGDDGNGRAKVKKSSHYKDNPDALRWKK